MNIQSKPRLLLFGGSGKLGRKMALVYSSSYEVLSPTHTECDITKIEDVQKVFRSFKPDIVINAAALVGAKECEEDKTLAWRVNVLGAANISRISSENNTRQIFISSAAIFDGAKGLYSEDEPPTPTYYYAITKVAAEQAVAMSTDHVIVRIDFFEPDQQLKYESVFTDHFTSKCSADDLVKKIAIVMESHFVGIINIGDPRDSLFRILKPFYPNIKPVTIADSSLPNFPRDISLDLSLWNRLFPS